MAELIIDDENYRRKAAPPSVDGAKMGMGLVPRDLKKNPYAGPDFAFDAVQMPLIPRSEWSDRIKEMEATKSRLSDLRRRGNSEGGLIPSLDQNGQGYCWAYSTGMALMMTRVVSNLPYVRLSPHAVACKIKGFRDEGGWCGLSYKFAIEHGYPDQKMWPQKSMSRSNDNEQTWANAAKYKAVEGYYDMSVAVYDQEMTFDQVMSCLLCRIPVISDFNWWGHSVCALDPVEVEKGSFGIRIINSWTDSWGDLGEAVLRGNKAIPDNAVAPRTSTVSLL